MLRRLLHQRTPAVRRLLAAEGGWSLVESLVGTVMLVIGLFGLMTMLDTGNRVTNANLGRDSGTGLAREVVERARQVPYATLAQPLEAAKKIAEATPGASTPTNGVWTTNRRGVLYTTTLNTCVVDDPADGLGPVLGVPCSPSNGVGGPGSGPNGGPPLTVHLNVLGLPINAAVGGGVLGQVCSALGQSALVDSLLSGSGVVNGLLGLAGSGADIGLCQSGGTTIGYDLEPQDLTRVTAKVTWTKPQPGSVVQSALVPRPGGGG